MKIICLFMALFAALAGLALSARAQEPLTAGGFIILGKPPGKVDSQDMGAFGGKWQDGDQLWWTGAKPGDKLTLVVPIQQEGIYQVSVAMTRARDYAIVQLSLDGIKVGKRIDLFDQNVVPTGPIPLGTHKLSKGNHSLGIEIVGANAQADKAYMVGVDYLVFRPANDALAPAFTHPKSLYPYVSLAPEAAAKAMRLPKGFSVQVAAAEPDVKQPIAMAFDDRGRLWVAEAYEYPRRAPEGKGRDRILIFEDTRGTGTFDKRTVFIDNLNLVTGLEVGFGGVWVGAAPYLLFIPVKDGEDRPAGPAKILLDGWGYQDTHETLNSFIWGPDGWLYGCHGVFTHSQVGEPGTPDAKRVPINAGIWRYHPIKHKFEVFAEGTSNPWGIDFDDHGQAFCTACVIPHLFHIVQGARYQRQAGGHFNPNTYADIPTIADHLHYLGNQWNTSDRKRSDDLGGGHAHAGAMIYLGGSWPEKYRKQIFMNNIHGNRINMDTLRAKGSGFVGSHGPDFILTDDQSSQILNLRYGADGSVWMIDWYDRNQCHHGNVAGHDRTNGRIFRVSYNHAKPVKVDLRKLSDRDLVRLQLHENDWYVRHSRRLLQERAAKLDSELAVELIKIVQGHPDETRRLRALWTLNVIGRFTGTVMKEFAIQLLANDRAYVRAWTIQLLCENSKSFPVEILDRFAQMARKDPSPVVRLYLASALQRLPLEDRWPILEGLIVHPEDALDHNLPLMYWYAMEPLAGLEMRRALALGLVAGENIPILQTFMVRRIGSGNTEKALQLLVEGLGETKEARRQLAFLRGMNRALVGRRKVAPPEEWAKVYDPLASSKDRDVRLQATALAVTFGDARAIVALRHVLADRKADVAERNFALVSLLGAGVSELIADLHGLVADPVMRAHALRALAAFDDPKTPGIIFKVYATLALAEKRDALATLCARVAFAQDLLTAIEKKHIPAGDLTADLVRQLRDLTNAGLNKRIGEIWGSVTESTADMTKLIARYKTMLKTPAKMPPDPFLGRAVFAKTCQQCHTLYGTGGKVGPDITGSNRSDLDYILSNVLDPSAVMAKEYQPSIVVTTMGRLVTGIVKDSNANAVTLQTVTETVVVPRKEIEEMHLSKQSMMPNDLLKALAAHEVRSLVAYLMGRRQVPMLATPDNVAGFFNGLDLAGWHGAEAGWKVEKGEIVCKPETKPALLVSDLWAGDFHLSVEVKTSKDAAGALLLRGDETGQKGLRAEVGAGKWGRLTLDGRLLQAGKPGVQSAWTRLEMFASGSRVQLRIDGKDCLQIEDERLARRGIIALEGQGRIRFRKLDLKLLP